MSLSTSAKQDIEKAIVSAIDCYQNTNDIQPNIITDIYLQPLKEEGYIYIYNDDDELLSQVEVDGLTKYNDANFYPIIKKELSSILSSLRKGGAFDHLLLMEPYSFVMTKESKEETSELLIIDSDTFLVDDELLKGYNKELDDFLDQLLND